LLLALVLVACALAPAAAAAAERYNVLLICSDDMRPALGCYGDAVARSPRLDQLAARAVRFDRAYCQYPLCNPSRTSFLTGRHPVTTGVLDNQAYFRAAHPDWVTLPEHFRRHGYATLRTGKIFHGGIDDRGSWDVGAEPDGATPPRQPTTAAERQQRVRRSDAIVVLPGDGATHNDYKTRQRAIELLGQHADKPFFLAVGFTKPHSPPTAPQSFFDLFEPAGMRLPKHFAARPQVGPGHPAAALTSNGDLFVNRPASQDEARAVLEAYYASVAWTDYNVGAVLDELDRLGLREKTVVVFWGDHGYHLGEWGKWSKHGSLYEVGTRVPFLIDAPGAAAAGSVVAKPVQSLDLFPTLCQLCSLDPPAGLEGASLAPLLADPAAAWDRPAYSVAGSRQKLGVAVRTERYRYAEWNAGRDGAMLFDEQADPDEQTNLVDDPALAAIRDQLQKLAREHAAKLVP
jgi:arylsulfatase A-like enzyme